jgi:hypothetical protein
MDRGAAGPHESVGEKQSGRRQADLREPSAPGRTRWNLTVHGGSPPAKAETGVPDRYHRICVRSILPDRKIILAEIMPAHQGRKPAETGPVRESTGYRSPLEATGPRGSPARLARPTTRTGGPEIPLRSVCAPSPELVINGLRGQLLPRIRPEGGWSKPSDRTRVFCGAGYRRRLT